MKQNILLNSVASIVYPCLAAGLLLITGCRKEKTLDPSEQDENYFIVKDNPDVPADHARYGFYESTGIASFYNDTIHRKRISDLGELPRYSYVTLSLEYSISDLANIKFKLIDNKENIPAVLDLVKQNVLPGLPDQFVIPSIFLIDTFYTSLLLKQVELAHGWTSWHGFNTIGISVQDVTVMNSEERKMYAASILAGIAERRLTKVAGDKLQKDFFSVSRAEAKFFKSMGIDVYSGYPLTFLPPAMIPPPRPTGLLRYTVYGTGEGPREITYPCLPREADDSRAFLTAAFYYTAQEFTALYSGDAFILKKFNIIRNIAQEAGFKLPE
ncbi:hypothetical protein [Pseudobacter ginsenosidimutans]|nr:hypothetical protein [Pseudobacter ginsenosidimutans]QEC43805.1 hypothetical protein FSB84_19765 [Pseudobacter ginsenosidimutans]